MSKIARWYASKVFGGGGGAPWYRAGGAPVPLAVYNAVGAASLAAARINLVTPGTLDLTNVTAASPGWTAADGFVFAADGVQNTGIVPANTVERTAIIAYTQTDFAAGRSPFGARTANSLRVIYSNAGDNTLAYNGTNGYTHTRITTGVVAIAGLKVYLDGAEIGSIAAGTYDISHEIRIGAYNNGGSSTLPFIGSVRQFAYYTATLTAPQVLAVSTAMANLA